MPKAAFLWYKIPGLFIPFLVSKTLLNISDPHFMEVIVPEAKAALLKILGIQQLHGLNMKTKIKCLNQPNVKNFN